ncbi:transporter [Rhodococcus sp. 1168]|uniref:PH-like domain-containing protein n=1 Tax=Rhodococcus sp. 1168 TaxID=2018041 RepID=UPI000A0CAD4B|nr:transporter [Rhodococcus sp. 1168]ORI22593.1 transporter [Rhodococcus sp. 1168]
MDRVLIVIAFIVFWLLMIALIFWGWRGRQKRQADRIGTFPGVPSDIGSTVLEPSTGLYVGSTIAPSWQDRIAVGDIGHRATAELSRHQHGILLVRTGESTIWIPEESIRAIRTERGLAGKVMSKDGLLVIRWELPTGTEIDTGFRADDKFVYPAWVDTDTNTDSGSSAGTDDSKETPA